VDWIHLAEDEGQWRVVVKKNPPIQNRWENLG
jgi:hypothetical protein